MRKNTFKHWLARALDDRREITQGAVSSLAEGAGVAEATLYRWEKGKCAPHFDGFILLAAELDPYLAGVLEYFLAPECDPADSCRLTPQRARRLLREWLRRKLASEYATRRCPEGNKTALVRDLKIRGHLMTPGYLYRWVSGQGMPTLRNFLGLAKVLEPALFEQIEESFSL